MYKFTVLKFFEMRKWISIRHCPFFSLQCMDVGTVYDFVFYCPNSKWGHLIYIFHVSF